MGNRKQRIEALRDQMRRENVDACIVPSTDTHLSEYPSGRWKTREWLSGFTGSAGTLVVTQNRAVLWTDSRYFLQAEKELKDTGIYLFKSGLPCVPGYQEWVANELISGQMAGIECSVFSAEEALALGTGLSKKGILLKTDFAPYSEIWKNRPAAPRNPMLVLNERFAGKSCREKISCTREAIIANGAEMTIISVLDEVAWLFNIRGSDVRYNPVCAGYAAVSEHETIFFVNREKITEKSSEHFREQGVTVYDYDTVADYIKQRTGGKRLLIDPSHINYELYSSIPEDCIKVEVAVSPVAGLKSIKNDTEIAGFRSAMQRDGVAMIRFLIYLETALAKDEPVTETMIASKLRKLRGYHKYYAGESFATIAGYGAHAAVVHYEADAESDAAVLREGMLLVDSGAHYLDGTTDVTRTISVGPVSDSMKRDFTLVLKGHIALATARFPAGTVGMQIDAFARQFLWQSGLNYLHGTGHGVGHFLPVHEGPQSIRTSYSPVALKPGMIISNEPGVYREGQYGIRIENLLLTVYDTTNEFGEFYRFETLTLCPIDRRLIDFPLLTNEEINWLNDYHTKVFESLSPSLSAKEREWLRKSLFD
ncbi:MAG: aminopeptidase P family protein [Dysgonamonadaceae bacterium]|jgi:Xaa-Pro aminopeptidase|nr:aminopeptidase P family protein [Dysgonamonadaceae bacterium]